MKKILFSLSLLLAITGLLMVGCNKDATGPEQLTDSEFLSQQVTSVDSLAGFLDSEDISLNDGSEKDFDYNDFGMMKPDAVITPLKWGRKIESVTKTVLVQFPSDTIAIATVHKEILGKFIVKGIATTGDTIKVEKPYTTNTYRKIRFRKIGNFADPKKNWIPVAMSLVQGQTANTNFGISQVEVFTSSDTATVTDPLTYWLRMVPWKGGVPALHIGDTIKVRLTITSPNDSAEYAILRHGSFPMMNKRIRQRMTLVSQTGSAGAYTRIYEKKFIAHLPMGYAYGRFNTLVDVMSYKSINDDQDPFMNMFWGMPYVVRR
jgi:hypothetical protein